MFRKAMGDSSGPEASGQAGTGDQRAPVAGAMTEREACDILGVTPGCTREEVVAAHRKLMQKVHPDRGGNDYLAAKLNEARDLLIGKRGA